MYDYARSIYLYALQHRQLLHVYCARGRLVTSHANTYTVNSLPVSWYVYICGGKLLTRVVLAWQGFARTVRGLVS